MSIRDGLSEDIDNEFEALKAIYLEDIIIDIKDMSEDLKASVLVDIHPKTGHKTNDHFVRLTLALNIPKDYPNEWPVFDFKNIRGLTDDKIERIKSNIENVCEDKRGETMIYDIIESSRDILTALNSPEGNRCAICLYDITVNDETIRTECFHHLHCHCFANYVVSRLTTNDPSKGDSNQLRLQCPVCRIDINLSDFTTYINPNLFSMPFLSTQPLVDESDLIEEAKISVKKFNDIYERQLKSGGIIDTNNDKFFIRISETNYETNIS